MLGERFGRLTAMSEPLGGGKRRLVLCLCECGAVKYVGESNLRSGGTKSCGCLAKDILRERQTRHGRYYEPEFRAWSNMKKRCSEARWAKWYGSIKICDRWLASYDDFLSDVGCRPSTRHTLDRVDSKLGYEPGNVRWATRATQSRNTKNYETNKTGIRGVSWAESKQKWRVAIYVDNKQKHVGYFDNQQDAAVARKAAEEKYWGDER